jgi:alkanesulfonate monooxygenase SsuD/methylene tetrahydromethanopterin reductase-like flavin-dependent oxidoreductase (luciferase family)
VHVTLCLDPTRPWPALRALAEDAERAGWDGVRCGDPVAGAGRECWAVLGALAAAVPRLRLEAAISGDRGRHPAVIAKLAATVDRLSDGRLLLGLTPAAGADGEARLAEVIEVVRRLARDDRTTWRGQFYRLQDAPLDPKPMQQPFPLMLIGGRPDLAAAHADHWSISGDIGAQLAALAQSCQSVGRDRATITVSADKPAEGVDELVIPDSALGPDPARWPMELRRIRAATR